MLTKQTLTDFGKELASSSPAPGGGSVAALSGSLSAGLIAMVCRLTLGKKAFEDHEPVLRDTLDRAEVLRDELTRLIDTDTEAFNRVMAAFKMPRATEQDKADRSRAVQQAFCLAAETPLSVMSCCLDLMALALDIRQCFNPNCTSDFGVAVESAFAGLKGALMNVKINLPSIRDETYVRETGGKAEAFLEKAVRLKRELDGIILARLYGK